MDLVCSTEIDEAEYVRFLDGFAGQPGIALAYHYPFYLRFLADAAYPGSTLRFVTARNGRGKLVGAMPGLQVCTPRVNVWLSLAYFGPNAGAVVPHPNGSEGGAVVEALVAAAQADARERGCGSMTIYTPLQAEMAKYRAGLGLADFEIHRTSQCMTIPADPDQSPWPRKVRYDIRRALSLGIMVRPVATLTELDAIWDIYRVGCKDAGIPIKPRDHIRRLYETAGDHGLFLAAEHDGEIIAGLICLVGAGVLSYYLPCTRPDKRSLQPGLLLLDHDVAIARARGCRLLNFEASPAIESSVYRFKARCGGRPVPYHVLVKLLRAGVIDEYRELAPEGLRREAPHAFVVPFEALA